MHDAAIATGEIGVDEGTLRQHEKLLVIVVMDTTRTGKSNTGELCWLVTDLALRELRKGRSAGEPIRSTRIASQMDPPCVFPQRGWV
jgi:hypothetical protein